MQQPEDAVSSTLLRVRTLLKHAAGGQPGRPLTASQIIDGGLELLEELRCSEAAGESLSEDARDWVVLRALLEVIIRWGVLPRLPEEVGIPPERRLGGRSPGVQGGSAQQVSAPSGPPAPGSLVTEELCLLRCTQLLAKVALPAKSASCPDLEPGSPTSPLHTTENTSKHTRPEPDSLQNQPTGTSSEAQGEHEVLQAGILKHLVLQHHLSDIVAAYLQLAHRLEQPSSCQLSDSQRQECSKELSGLLSALQPNVVVRALMPLLGGVGWLRADCGRLLSLTTMRQGGVSAVLEWLVGGVDQAEAAAYVRAAEHIVTPPRRLTTPELYFSAVGPQLAELILLRPSSGTSPKEVTAQQTAKNLRHVAALASAALLQKHTVQGRQYLLPPLVEPLASWHAACRSVGAKASAPSVRCETFVDSILAFQAVLLAGGERSAAGEEVLRATQEAAPYLLRLYCALSATEQDTEETSQRRLNELQKGLSDLLVAHLRQRPEVSLPLIRSALDQVVDLITVLDGAQGKLEWAVKEQGKGHFKRPINTLLVAAENHVLITECSLLPELD